MPDFIPYTIHQLEFALNAIRAAVYTEIAPLEAAAWRTPEPTPFAQRTSGTPLTLTIGESWGGLFDCAWFRFRGAIPPQAAGQAVVALLDVSGELCVVDEAGNPRRGLTNLASSYDFSLGRPGKRVLPLTSQALGGEPVEIWADAGCNDLFGNLQGNGALREACLAIVHPETRALGYDFEVLLDALGVLPEQSARRQQILVALNDATHLLWNGVTAEAVAQARQALAPVLTRQGGDPALRISAIGHAHIDLGWLWPIRETKRKGARTFATALANLELYPEAVFAASQPQLFQWMKEGYPELYERIRQKVKEGRLEPQGALWVECDTNLTGGESLVRQLLHGKRFFQQEFGVELRYVWLPDTFGYSAALPQIIKQAGCDYFSTQKLSWSLVNRFPHHSFHWQGLDATQVLVHMLPEETYNSAAAPRSLAKIEANYAEKGVSQHCLLVYGIGDGGGGPGEEHLERLARLRNFAGLNPVKPEWTAAFFEEWAKDSGRFPTWSGELYLERHQGTFTTNARNKWYNRRLEQALREVEWTAALAQRLTGAAYPAEQLEAIWKEVLLYQFHDILPGSSIKRVYDESLARYRILLEEVEDLLAQAQLALASQAELAGMRSPLVVFNSLSWSREAWLPLGEGGWRRLHLPPLGYTAIDAAAPVEPFEAPSASTGQLENDCLRVRFAADGAIASLYDKQARREAIPAGEQANRLVVFHDYGDAWDIPMDYAESRPRPLELAASRAWVEGPRAVVEQLYRLGKSELVQQVSLTAGSPVLEFSSRLRWLETETMLRALFPVAVQADQAAFEIQFGHVFRPTHSNTTWDLARDEVPAQKWVDLSRRDFGVALLNDSKYGHRVKGHTLELNLLRSVLYPGQRVVFDQDVQPGEPNHAYTDQGEHIFRYALYPHAGDHVVGRVAQVAYEFNLPARSLALRPGGDLSTGALVPVGRSFIQVEAPEVIVETVKQAEDGSGLILRLYEGSGARVRTALELGFSVQAVEAVNLLEQSLGSLPLEGGRLELDFHPFEIKSLRLR